MPPSKRLRPVQRIATHRERDAARAFGASQQTLTMEEAKLEELRRYHREYQARFEQEARNGMDAGQLQSYRAFLVKLEVAIEQQKEVVAASQAQRQRQRQRWQKRYTRSQALDKVAARYQEEEKKQEEQREQKASDDRNQRRR